MGIQNILPVFAPALAERHIGEFEGQVAAIDVSGWMYRAHDPTDYISSQVKIIQRFSVKPILVFDGQAPDAKEEIVKDRQRKRNADMIRATELERDGKKAEADKLRRRATRRPAAAKKDVIDWCRREGVSYVESPFEADAEIAFLIKSGIAQLAITEDSDFLTFGCEVVLFKYHNGFGYVYNRSKFEDCWGAPYDMECFRAVCILVGSDYYKGGLNQFGPVKAIKLYKQLGGTFNFEKMTRLVKMTGLDMKKGFKKDFNRAVETFLYQLVWDPATSKVVPLTPYPTGKSHVNFPFAGALDQAKGSHLTFESRPGPDVNPSCICSICKLKFPSPLTLRVHMQEQHPLECSTCQRKFQYRRYLEIHERTHHPENKCQFCDKHFSGSFSLHQHYATQHPRERPFVCSICSKDFKRKTALDAHLPIHSVDIEVACDRCDLIFKNENDLTAHKMTHDVEFPLSCGICKERFKERQQLIQHVQEHLDGKTVACEICGLRLKDEEELELHIIEHSKMVTQPLPFSCDVCHKAFGRKRSLAAHKKTHRKDDSSPKAVHTCETCGKELSSKSNLYTHMKTHSSRRPFVCSVCKKDYKVKRHLDLHILSQHSTQRRFVCKECGKGFVKKDHFDDHMRSHSDDKEFQCKLCDRVFKYVQNLKAHMKKSHPSETDQTNNQEILKNDGPLPKFACETCGKRYEKMSALSHHKRTHMPVRPFVCGKCGQGCFNQGDLNQHMKIHSSERPHVCEICSKSYKQKFALNQHMYVHSKEPRFVCKVCGKGCTHKSTLVKHSKIHSSERPFVCEFCNEGFKLKQYLNYHLKNAYLKSDSIFLALNFLKMQT